MEVNVFNMEGKKVSKVELPPAIFEAPISIDLMHQAYVRQMANARLGTHDTKPRGEVRGGGRKPWRQKGTGRARHGSIRSTIWVGGGKIHTPHPRDYSQSMPRKMRLAAMRSALSAKAAENEIVIVDELKVSEAKTSLMARALNTLVGDASVLILIPEKERYSNEITSISNIPDVKILLSGYINIRDLLGYDRLVLPLSALEKIQSHLG